MPAVIELDESNGDPTEVVTHAVGTLRMGTVDQAELVAGDPGEGLGADTDSMQKALRVHLTALGGGGGISRLRVYGEPPVVGWTLHTNLSDDPTEYDAAKITVYVPPAATQGAVSYALPPGDPGSPNLGIGGDLEGTLVAPGLSDYSYLQARSTAAVTSGFESMPLFLAYDELG